MKISYNSINDENFIERASTLNTRKNNSNDDFFDTVSHFSVSSSSIRTKRKLEKNSYDKTKSRFRNNSERLYNNPNDNLKETLNEQNNCKDLKSLKNVKRNPVQRRNKILPRPNETVNFEIIKGILKNAIGKDLSKIPIPCNFSEPISFLQRFTEMLEYSHLLDKAAQCHDPLEQMAYVAAFSVSNYSTSADRQTKPFNPMMGETFEFDRLDDLGWRSVGNNFI